MTAPGLRTASRAGAPTASLALPPLDDIALPGQGIADHATTLVLATFGLLMLVAGLASIVVPINVTIPATGVLEPGRVVAARARTAAAVVGVDVRTGQAVHAGQVVARLDALAAQSALEELRAQHRANAIALEALATGTPFEERESADALAHAEARVLRARALLRERIVENGFNGDVTSFRARYVPGSHVAIDVALSELLSAEADVRAAHTRAARIGLRALERRSLLNEAERLAAEIREMAERIARTAVVAPADGIVLTDELERLVGTVPENGAALIEVGDTRAWRVELMVQQGDIHRVTVGDRILIEVPALASTDVRRLEGRVEFTSGQADRNGAAATAPAASTYRVVASLDATALGAAQGRLLRRGYVVRGRIVTRAAPASTLFVDWFRARRAQLGG